jgi:hypothetical protein
MCLATANTSLRAHRGGGAEAAPGARDPQLGAPLRRKLARRTLRARAGDQRLRRAAGEPVARLQAATGTASTGAGHLGRPSASPALGGRPGRAWRRAWRPSYPAWSNSSARRVATSSPHRSLPRRCSARTAPRWGRGRRPDWHKGPPGSGVACPGGKQRGAGRGIIPAAATLSGQSLMMG